MLQWCYAPNYFKTEIATLPYLCPRSQIICGRRNNESSSNKHVVRLAVVVGGGSVTLCSADLTPLAGKQTGDKPWLHVESTITGMTAANQNNNNNTDEVITSLGFVDDEHILCLSSAGNVYRTLFSSAAVPLSPTAVKRVKVDGPAGFARGETSLLGSGHVCTSAPQLLVPTNNCASTRLITAALFTWDHRIAVIDPERLSAKSVVQTHGAATGVAHLPTSPDSTLICTENGDVALYDVRASATRCQQRIRCSHDSLLCISPYLEKEIIVAGLSRSVQVIDLTKAQVRTSATNVLKYEICSLVFDASSALVLASGADAELAVVCPDPPRGEKKMRLEEHHSDDAWQGRLAGGDGFFCGIASTGSVYASQLIRSHQVYDAAKKTTEQQQQQQ
eukprot:PhM_4_TR4866/c0_g1_i1/m.31818